MPDARECLTSAELNAIAGDLLTEHELHRCESHIERCPACRESLEACAADGNTWEAARAFLPEDSYDSEVDAFHAQNSRDPLDPFAELLHFLAPTDDPRMLGRLGAHEISGIIGAGGMGVVLKAFEPALGRFVALKILSPRFWSDPQARERFSREARAAASIVHDNVIEIYSVSEYQGVPFLTMPYLRGDSLQKRIDKSGALKVEEILRVSMQVAAGLAAAHAQGLVHRDIKPANILLGDGADRVRITDFGIARLGTDPEMTQTGFVAGTPEYMSPEQVRGEPLDGRSDLFSLGSVMYAMCAGRPPFAADTYFHLLNRVVDARPPRIEKVNPAIPTWLAAIVSKLHSPSPDDRHASAKELAAELEQCLASVQQPDVFSKPRSVTELDALYSQSNRKRNHYLVAGGVVMSAVAALFAAFYFSSFGILPGARDAKFQEPTTAATRGNVVTVMADQPRKLSHNDGTAEDRRSMAGAAEWVSFTLPGDTAKIEAVRIHGSRYGYPQPPKEDIKIYFANQDFSKTIAERTTPYSKFEKGEAKWNHIRLAEPVEVPKEFWVGVDFDAEQTKGVYVSIDKSTDGSHSRKGAPGKEAVAANVEGDWMIEVVLTKDSPVKTSIVSARPQGALALADEKSADWIVVKGKVVDAKGAAVANTSIYAVQKIWPNNQYQQNMLKTTTDDKGEFNFEDFATKGERYAFLVTVVSDEYLMTSVYRLVQGKQVPPITLKTEKAEPVTLQFKTADGQPVAGVTALPYLRLTKDRKEHMTYAFHQVRELLSPESDDKGEIQFASWKPGEKAKIVYLFKVEPKEFEFTVPADRIVALTVGG